MLQTLDSTRKPPHPTVDVLVVSTEAQVRERLAAHVLHALPMAQVHELAQLADLVYRVAGSGVDLVVLDAQPSQRLPLTPLMVQMLKGIQPALRIVCVAGAPWAATPTVPSTTDASLTEAGLGDWLRATYGSGAGPKLTKPSAHHV